MTVLKSPYEIAAMQQKCDIAYDKITKEQYTSNAERMQLMHDAFPFAYRPGISGLEGRLTVVYDQTCDAISVQDLGGWLTTILTPQTLWDIIKTEANEAGALRHKLTGKNPVQAHRELTTKANEKYKVKKYTEAGKLEVSLDDLDL
jgi:hypothetical protein